MASIAKINKDSNVVATSEKEAVSSQYNQLVQRDVERFVALLSHSDPQAVLLGKTITEHRVKIHYQPIVEFSSKTIFAYEALLRCDEPLLSYPPDMFEIAEKQGVVGELGRLLRHLAVAGCEDYPLFINIHPSEFDEPWLIRPDDPVFFHPEMVHLEITESVPLHYFDQCEGVIAEARGKGLCLAIDDLGAGYSNLKYISDLCPEVVKLDRMLIAGLRDGSRLWRLVRSIVTLCVEMGARVVAEGIETEEEMNAAITAGAHFGQGYIIARPGLPPPQPIWPEGF